MVFDTMSDACQIIGLGDPVKGRGDRPQPVWSSGTLKEDFSIVVDLCIVFREGGCAACVTQLSD